MIYFFEIELYNTIGKKKFKSLMTTILYFSVRAHTQFYQQIKVCGNIPELGNWNPKKALPLTTNESLYPTWINPEAIQVYANKYSTIEFKCIIEQ